MTGRVRAVGARARRLLARTPAPAAGPAVADLPEQRHVVVVAYGRSGSTLVQGLLNTLPRTLVRGENGLYVLYHFRAWQHLRDFRDLHLAHNPREASSAFYGLDHLRPRSVVRSTRALVRQHLLGDRDADELDVLGFKDVAWHRVRHEEVPAFLDFLEQVLPECRYVLTTRNLDDVVTSGYWKGQDREAALTKIRRVERFQEHLRTTRPDRVLDVPYERLTDDDASVRDATMAGLAEFVVGSCDDGLLAALRETATRGHGPFPFGESRTRRRDDVNAGRRGRPPTSA